MPVFEFSLKINAQDLQIPASIFCLQIWYDRIFSIVSNICHMPFPLIERSPPAFHQRCRPRDLQHGPAWDTRRRLLGKAGDQLDQWLAQATVAQVGRTKFIIRPVSHF